MFAHHSIPPGSTSRLCRYDAPLATTQAVRHVRDTLARWGLDGSCEEATDAVVVAGELLANARQHGGGARAVEVSWHGPRLRVAVSDANRAEPRLVWPRRPTQLAGHGLHVVERLTARWGTFARRDGKTVWAELRIPAETARRSRRRHRPPRAVL